MLMSIGPSFSEIHGLRRNSSCGSKSSLRPWLPKTAYITIASRTHRPSPMKTLRLVVTALGLLERLDDQQRHEKGGEEGDREQRRGETGLLLDQPGAEHRQAEEPEAGEHRPRDDAHRRPA